MTIRDITEKAAEILRATTALAGVPVIVEEKGDVANALALELAKRRIAVVLRWNGFTSEGNSSKTIFGKANLVATVYELPVINRREPTATTLLGVAQAIANALNLEQLGDDSAPFVFTNISQVDYAGGSADQTAIQTTITFETNTTL